jgi:hypothetical protein
MQLKRGVVKAFDSGSYKATVQLMGSLSVWLEGIAVARNIPEAEMIVGRNCALVFFTSDNPSDAVLIAVF